MGTEALSKTFESLFSDNLRGVGAGQPDGVHIPRAVGRAAGCAVVSQPLGGAGVRVGQHHGLSHCRTGTIRLRSGPAQPAAGQTLRAEGKETARQGWVFKLHVDEKSCEKMFLLTLNLNVYLYLYSNC